MALLTAWMAMSRAANWMRLELAWIPFVLRQSCHGTAAIQRRLHRLQVSAPMPIWECAGCPDQSSRDQTLAIRITLSGTEQKLVSQTGQRRQGWWHGA